MIPIASCARIFVHHHPKALLDKAMNGGTYSWLWIFNSGSSRPAAVFACLEKSVRWIADQKQTGTLTAYPVGPSLYEWALESNIFRPKRPDQKDIRFIQRFSSASQSHFHFEEGCCSHLPETTEQEANMGLSPYAGDRIWLFLGEGGRFPAGAFESLESAQDWVANHGATGKIVCLTVTG